MNKELEIMDIIQMMLKRLWLIVILMITFAAIGYGYVLLFLQPIYTANVKMLVNNVSTVEKLDGTLTTVVDNTRKAQDLIKVYSIVVKSNAVLRLVSNDLEENYDIILSPQQIREQFTLVSVDETEVFMIQVVDNNPYNAAKIANSISLKAPDEIKRIVKSATAIEIIDPAEPNRTPTGPNTWKYVLLGAGIGVVIAICAVLILEFSDKTIKSEQELIDNYDLPVLGSIPMLKSETV